MVTLGSTGITVPQNAFGALPIQRDDFDTASKILRRAYEGGMTFFDTARAYSDSEEKIGIALSDVRNKIYIATKTAAKTPDEMKSQLETSLKMLKTDYIDIYQFHQSTCCYRPGDGSGMYEQMGISNGRSLSGILELHLIRLTSLMSASNPVFTKLCSFPSVTFRETGKLRLLKTAGRIIWAL